MRIIARSTAVLAITVAASLVGIAHVSEPGTALAEDVTPVVAQETPASAPETALVAPVPEVPEVLPTPEVTPVPEPDAAPVIQEDDPRWDCRTMGNRTCGVEIMGAWYLVTFDADGLPIAVEAR